MKSLILFVGVIVQFSISGYTTPNTGVKWNFDSLVFHSGGIVTGTFPTYVISDTVFIAQNDLLDIRKGSIIKIGYRKGITIRGGFLALGTKDSLISFTANDSTWQELRFEDSAIDSLCKMEFIVIEYARLGLNFISSSPSVQYSTIKNTGVISGTLAGSGNYGIQCFNSNAIIRYDSIYNNAQYGININSGANPLIEHCVIFNNNLQGTSFKNQISIGAQGVNSPIIRHNEISHTTPNIRVGAISISAFFAGSGSNAIIENNYIHHNAYGIAVASQGTSSLNIKIRKNKITNNTFNDQNAAGSGINFNSASPSLQISTVSENEITHNTWGITVLGNAKPNLGDLTNSDSTDDGRNVFINNKNRDTIFALYNNNPNPLKAQNNYWGYSDPDSVAKVIFDSTDYSSLGKVTYEPFLIFNPLTSVSIDGKRNFHPTGFELMNNFPNPFNPATTIRFIIPQGNIVSLKIFDVLGREVETLLNGYRDAGTHTVQWNSSGIYSSGMYYYRFESANFVITKKMLLQK